MSVATVAASVAKKEVAKKVEGKVSKPRHAKPENGRHRKPVEEKASEKAPEKESKKKSGRSPSEHVYDKGSALIGNRPRYWEPKSVAGYRRILTAEFIVCMLLIILKPMKAAKNDPNYQPWGSQFYKKVAAVWIIFFVLGIFSSIGWKTARIAAAFGGLVTIVLAVGQESAVTDFLSAIAARVSNVTPSSSQGQDGGPPPGSVPNTNPASAATRIAVAASPIGAVGEVENQTGVGLLSPVGTIVNDINNGIGGFLSNVWGRLFGG